LGSAIATTFGDSDIDRLCSLACFLIGCATTYFVKEYFQDRQNTGLTRKIVLFVLAAQALVSIVPACIPTIGRATICFTAMVMGSQAVTFRDLKSPLGTTVVLTSVWTDAVTENNLAKQLIRWSGLIACLLGAILANLIGKYAGVIPVFVVSIGVRILTMATFQYAREEAYGGK